MSDIPTPEPCPRLLLDFNEEGSTFNGRHFAGPVRVEMPFPPPTARVLVEHAVEAYGQDFVADIIGLGPEVRRAMEAMVGREVERLGREAQRLLTGDDQRRSVVANAIGIGMFSHDRPVTPNAQGVDQIEVTDDEAERCRSAAAIVLAHLEAYDHA